MAESMEVSSTGAVPITGVTLYDNGYAVFERETTVNGNGQIDLFFPKNLIKDVLESLQFAGEAAGNVGNIAYEATKPTATVEFNKSSPFVALLKSLVGSNVTIDMKGGSQETGRVIGIENNIPSTDPNLDNIPHVSVYKAGGRLKVLPITEIDEVFLQEERTQQDISFSLDLTKNESRDDNMQKLSVFYSNVDSPKKLVTRYGFKLVNEWKSSYRMTYSLDTPCALMLHGLAIIENSLWEDWNDVRVTLVVGTPAIQDSTDTKDEGQWSLSVKSLDGSTINVRANPRDSVLRLKAKIGKKKGISPFSFKLMYCGKAVEDGRQLSDYTINDGTQLHMTKVDASHQLKSSGNRQQTQFVMAAQGNLSSYHIPAKVTAQRKQKAIVTMLNAQLEGQHVIFYDETIRKGNPLCAILFENSTGRTLDGGSLILSTQDAFLGQSKLPTLSPGDESPPIPFAVELGCEVVKSSDSTYLKPNRVEVVDGSINYYRIHRVVTIYRIQNKTDAKIDFILNHLFLEDYDLVQKPNVEEEEPVDITDRFYQFRFEVPSKCEKKSFLVREEITDCKKYSIQSLDEDEFDRFVGRKHFDLDTEKAVRKTFALRKEISSLEKGIYEIEAEIRDINKNQSHIRENISALEHHVKQAAKYITSLEVEEDKLKAAQEQLKKSKAKKSQLQKTLTSSIHDIKYNKVLKVATDEVEESSAANK